MLDQSVKPLLLNAKQTAAALGISPRKLWELTNRGEAPCVRIGRRVLYDPRDLAAWIDAQKRQPQDT
ncbi:MAG: helix-turn-helix domain-containing protein [Planctomycetes bacterium]|nr:helix-turn-helix domain-containing protein [Planctomycetota bacterium]